MSARKLKDSLPNLGSAVVNLERALTLPTEREPVFEGTIHRFEIVAELMWTTLKRAGIRGFRPEDTARECERGIPRRLAPR